MIKTLTLAVISLATITAFSQDSLAEVNNSEAVFEKCSHFFKTPAIRDIIKYASLKEDEESLEDSKDKPINPMRHSDLSKVSTELEEDGALQSKNGTKNNGGYRLAVNISGESGGTPPDPSGAAGHNYYMQAVNSTFRIWHKDGSIAAPSINLIALWEKPGAGDPIVMYDRFAERWFISQFYGEPGGSDNGILIAISVTSDPLGEYYAYEFDFNLFPDYPKFSVWSNAYFMSANSSSANCSAFQREKMLVGDPTAGVIKMSFPPIFQLFNSVAPAYAEGPTEPDMDEPCYFFAVQDNAYPGVSTDHILILKATINWASPGLSTVVEHQQLNTTAFNSNFSGDWTQNITQKGTDQLLDAIPGIFLYRAQYRRFSGGYNTIMLCHAANQGGNKAGMRWYELRDNNDGIWSIHQQSTYAPDEINSRWLGNISMDAQGNIAMAYSFAGTDHFAGLRYTGRFKDDPLNEMTVPELIAIEGTGAQTTSARYGDYSQMSVDPTDDMTFWFTGEYLAAGGGRRTRIFSFSSWHIAGVDKKKNVVPMFNAFQPNPSELTLKWSDLLDNDIVISVMDISGRKIAEQKLNNEQQEQTIQLSSSATGIYIVKLTGKNTNLSQKIYIGR